MTAEVLKVKAALIRTNCGRRSHRVIRLLLIMHRPILDHRATHHLVIRLIMDRQVTHLHHFKTQNRPMASQHQSVNMWKLRSRLQFRFIRNFHIQVEQFYEIKILVASIFLITI